MNKSEEATVTLTVPKLTSVYYGFKFLFSFIPLLTFVG